jgi:hypothetical protein
MFEEDSFWDKVEEVSKQESADMLNFMRNSETKSLLGGFLNEEDYNEVIAYGEAQVRKMQ